MPGGRPTMMTDELVEDIVRYLQLGAYIETAASMAGLDRATFYTWMKRGAREKTRRRKHADTLEEEKLADKGRQRKIRIEERERRSTRNKEHRRTYKREHAYVQFHDAVEKAIAQSELADLAVISQAAKGGAVVETRTLSNGTVVQKHARPEWQAAAWRRERRNPKDWAQVRRLEVSGTEGGEPVQLTMADAFKAAYQKKRERESNGVPVNGARNGASASTEVGASEE